MEPKTLLIVDDEELLREMLGEILGMRDFQVLMAESGEKAMSILEVEKVDAVISDLEMPQGNGLWLLQKIQEKGLARIPVVILSGSVVEESQIIEAGATTFIPKNNLMNLLLPALKEIFGR